MLAKIFAALMGALLFLTPLPTLAQEGGNVFEINAKIYSQGRLIGNPVLRAMAGSEVVTAIHDVDGYGLRLTIDEAPNTGGSRFIINSRIYIPHDGQWILVAAPEIRSAFGYTAKFDDGSRYAIEYTVNKLGITATSNELPSLEDCPILKLFDDPAPLKGVTVVGTGALKTSLGDSARMAGPVDGNCCRSGNMTYCGTPGAGVCCSDGMTGNSCCAPS